MPRSSERHRDIFVEYSSRRPQVHADAPAHQRPVLPPITAAQPREDEDVPVPFRISHYTTVPDDTRWIKQVTAVRPNHSGMRSYSGGYVTIVDGRAFVRPGMLLLVCRREREGHETVSLFVYLPHDMWHQISGRPVVRAVGWHQLMRNQINEWAVLSRPQRVLRACTEASVDVQEMLFNTREGTDAHQQLQAALVHLNEISRIATGDDVELSEDSLRRSFGAWLARTAELLDTEEETIAVAIREAFPIPETPNPTGFMELLGVLAEALDNNSTYALNNLSEVELSHIQMVLSSINTEVTNMHRARIHRGNFLTQIDFRLARREIGPIDYHVMQNLARSEELTDKLTESPAAIAVYLSSKTRRNIRAQDVTYALSHIPALGTTPAVREETPRERLTRNVRIRRNQNG